jgi:hypothetical protein
LLYTPTNYILFPYSPRLVMASHPTVVTSLGGEDSHAAMRITPVENEKKVPLATSSLDGSQKDIEAGEGLQRGLSSWHLQFIAIGSAIGTGLVSFTAPESALVLTSSCCFFLLTLYSSSAAVKRSRQQGR